MVVRNLIKAGIAGLLLAACGPGVAQPAAPADPLERDQQAFVEALKPRGAVRPVIAILASNAATEITDFMLTHAVLQRADGTTATRS